MAPATGWPLRSTPTTLNRLVPGWSGTVARQVVTPVHVTGYSTPLNQIVLIETGAVPVTTATFPLTTGEEFTVNATLVWAAICEAMLVFAWVNQSLIKEEFWAATPLARKALYLASSKGPLLATFNGPFTSSCKARTYIRRKVGLLKMAAVLGSDELTVNRFAPGDQEPELPREMLKSNINSEYFVPWVPR